MKKIFAYSLLIALVFAACRKSDNPKLPDLIRVPTPNLILSASSDKFISPANPAGFKAEIAVDLKFKSDIPPKKMDVVIMKNNNKSTVKTLKADVTTFPTTVNITGQQLIDLFGAPIEDGDLFVVGVDITTQEGMVFQAFPPGGTGWGTGVANQAGGVTTSISFLKPCTFISAEYAGDFEVVSDEWADYKAGAVIPVSVVSPTQISFTYNPSVLDPGTAKPIILTINPADNSVSVALQEYGDYGGDTYSVQSVSGTASAVNPCDHSLSVQLKHSTTGFSGNYTIKLKKKG